MQTNSLSYYTDIANSSIFQTPIPFTSKYPSISHYQKILQDQKKFQTLIYKMIALEQSQSDPQSESGQIDIPALIAQVGYEADEVAYVAQALKIRYAECKREVIKRELCQGGRLLAGFNWRIKNVVGCSQFTHKNRVILRLELFISQGKRAQQAEIISLQISVPELRELLTKLKKIAKEVKTVNF